MANVAVAPVQAETVDYSNVISFDVIKNAKEQVETKPKRPSNKIAGKSSEVYAFSTKEEISAMINVFDKHIEEATNDNQKQIARRNKMLFVIGINLGIRASDLRSLKWDFFFDKQDDGSLKFKKFYVLQPLKQRKQKKFVKLYFNDAVKSAINNYISEYPIDNLGDYLFASRKGNEPVVASSLWRIVKDAAAEAGIEQNIGSHSLRKTFGFWVWHNAEDKGKQLVVLSHIFNHSSVEVTRKYIGVLDDEIEDVFNDLNLGI